MMKRVDGWEKRLKLAVQKHMALPSKFGVSDCYLLPDDVVEAVTGERIYSDVVYTTEQGAAKQLIAHGFKTVEDAFAAKFEAVHPAMAQRGDIGVIESDGVICGGVFTANGFVARDPNKLVQVPLSRVKTAFKVAR